MLNRKIQLLAGLLFVGCLGGSGIRPPDPCALPGLDTQSWTEIRHLGFALRLPGRYESAGYYGEDSVVERFQAHGVWFEYDWGAYSGPQTTLRSAHDPAAQVEFSECVEEVGGFPAVLGTWINEDHPYPYQVGIVWQEVGGADWLMLGGMATDRAGAEELLQIFRSARFPGA